jgi:hypothetical protein
MKAPIAIRSLLLASLVAATANAGVRRYARVGEMQGAPEVQVHAADPWRTAERNLPLIESSRIQSGPQDRLEVELDDGSFLRLAGDALAELSDYAQLSTGQRVTLISIDHGVTYFTGEPRIHDTLSLALPGTQITLRQGSRIRLVANPQSSEVAVLEGSVKFTTPSLEMDLRAGQFIRIHAGASDHFTLLREIPKMEADEWSEGRDKSVQSDMDRSGGWVQTPESGIVWKPRTDENWRPFRDGRWEWYDEAGYTWVARETWGWVPYHYGRWLQDPQLGWVWVPDRRPNPIYKPGDVYWLRGTGRIAWGPLAPSEVWTGAGRAQQYAPANSTVAPFLAGVHVIDPAGLDEKLAANPGEALAGMTFAVAPISPALSADRFEAQRPELKTAETPAPLVTSAEPRVEQAAYAEQAPPPAPPPPPPPFAADLPPAPVDYADASATPLETYIPVPVYTGIVVIDPPLREVQVSNPPASGKSPEPPRHEPPIKVPQPPEPPRNTKKDSDPKSSGN